MAYNPTTWGSNDVITKDRLNKMEQGVRTGTLLSGTDIDTDKDWGGKNITNVGALGTFTGNVGARSLFVDVPGDTVRKTFPGPGAIARPSTVVVASVTIPPDYDPAHTSAFRVKVACGANDVGNTVRTITVKCEGASVGSAGVGTGGGLVTIDTTASFGPGDALTVEATHGGAYDGGLSVSQVQICSARSTNIAACKVFPEAGAW